MRGIRSDRGQAGIALIIVIAWALSAVLVLTRTLVAAQEINSKVTVITGDLSSSKHDTGYVAQLNMTEQTASSILAAAQPLTGQIAVIQSTAAHIDQEVDGITPPVQSINGLVHTIHGQVGAILNAVNGGSTSIEQTLATIRGSQSSVILTDVQHIKADTSNIVNNVVGIEGDFCGLTGGFSTAAGLSLGSVLLATGPPCAYQQTPIKP